MLSYLGYKDEENWIIEEKNFNTEYLGKCESVMCQGNGYLGIRSVTEEHYTGEKRDLFVAGAFNQFDEFEVTELPNCADIVGIDLYINNVKLNLPLGKVSEYSRKLNLKTGELTRDFTIEYPQTGRLRFTFSRFVSLSDLHIIGQKIEITPLDQEVDIRFFSGIDGQMTNSGVQHFSETYKRLFDEKCLQLVQTTTQSKIDVITNLVHTITSNSVQHQHKTLILADRRKIYFQFDFTIKKGTTVQIEKISRIDTSRDKELVDKQYDLKTLCEDTKSKLLHIHKQGYSTLLKESEKAWNNKVWQSAPIEITSRNAFDVLAVRFAQYHLTIMTPSHDNRMNIGAKGLSGEGYKGHTFWDTEIFILPYFTWMHPQIARSLLEYRYLSLPGAHKKARENGYSGAMFPWESAWLEDGETTPVWGAADIVTGEMTKIWSGFIEQHITSDVAYAVWQYFEVTKDQDFMDRYGYEIIFDTAKFWVSRLEWDKERGLYGITDVVGPDEYQEHIDNNSFTNYTAHWNIVTAIEYYNLLKTQHSEIFQLLDKKLELSTVYVDWVEKKDRIYLPKPNKNGVIPQNDQFFEKKDIDLTRYKNQKQVGEIFKDYNLEQVNKLQVSKQADTLLLLYLFDTMFDDKVKRACWDYYEKRTLHDSSLSLSVHSILANDMGDYELAYELFKKATEIDLGSDEKSSDHGIHAASLGGIWQCAVCGFGGVRMKNGLLVVDPHLPKAWDSLRFPIMWHGHKVDVFITKEQITLKLSEDTDVHLNVEVRKQICTLRPGNLVTVALSDQP